MEKIETSEGNVQMALRRSNLIFYVMKQVAEVVHRRKYQITHEGTENIPRKGPVLIIPKHQYESDIVFEGLVLYDCVGRMGNWVMRAGLSGSKKFREKLGGIEFVRPTREEAYRARQETEHVADKRERREAIHTYLEGTVREANKEPTEYVEWLLQKGEPIILHVEGTRSPGKVTHPVMGLVNHIKDYETQSGIEIPLVIMGINYTQGLKRTRVHFNVGEQRSFQEDNLADTIYTELKRLSNLPGVDEV